MLTDVQPSGRWGRYATSAAGGAVRNFASNSRRRHRPSEEIALPFLASHAHQEVGGGAVFDAFGNH